MNTSINKAIEAVLKKFGDTYFIDDVVHKSRVIQDLDEYNEKLIEKFISNETLKKYFTIDIGGHTVIQVNKLIELFEADEYWDSSFTRYSKKIGLTVGGKFIDESQDVVLDFPYKDTVLKASMSKEDTDKDDLLPDEPFLNEVIAKEEIDVLLDKKILVNAKKYDDKGVYEVDSFDDNDNLIIKGNNLLALHTLKDRYAGKVKLIYIDPPYNTGSDSFLYNDQFNHSTWLTFIKNRLEIAKDLLTSQGSIAVHCDDNELAYLNVLMDEIFGKKNRICIYPRVTKKGGKSSEIIAKNHDYVLFYAKNKELVTLFAPEHNDEGFSNKDEHFNERGYYKLNQTLDYDSLQYSKGLDYPININGQVLYPGGSEEGFLERQKGIHMRADWAWRWSKELFEFGLKNDFIELKKGRDRTRIYTKTYQKVKIVEKTPKNYEITNIKRTKPLSTLELTKNKYSNDNATKHAEILGIKNIFDYTKPETMLAEIIKLSTNKNEILLDFFMGSATTQAVAHKMNRRYIGIEQMDYINTVSVPRLQKVIEGEQGGISKDVNWQGGGSFVYIELMEKNRGFIDSIRNAKNQNELSEVFTFLLEEAEIDFRVDLEKAEETLKDQSLDDQKRTLLKIIDKNQLYYNYSEIDDENVRDLISDNDYKFNKSFYGESGEGDE